MSHVLFSVAAQFHFSRTGSEEVRVTDNRKHRTGLDENREGNQVTWERDVNISVNGHLYMAYDGSISTCILEKVYTTQL